MYVVVMIRVEVCFVCCGEENSLDWLVLFDLVIFERVLVLRRLMRV